MSVLRVGAGDAQTHEREEFVVGQGQTYTPGSEMENMRVRRWVMEDDSRLELAEDMREWVMHAEEVTIGNNVWIIARGPDGSPGNDGVGRGTASRCQHGRTRGEPGGPGGRGGAGKAISLVMGVWGIKGLNVDVRGGRGGDGGVGGRGENGGRASCTGINGCRGGDGARGGMGGVAGFGGDGGIVDIRYWPFATDGTVFRVIPHLNGGEAGTAGLGGPGGRAGPGIECNWPVPDRGGGRRGGGRGPDGSDDVSAGRPGEYRVLLSEPELQSLPR